MPTGAAALAGNAPCEVDLLPNAQKLENKNEDNDHTNDVKNIVTAHSQAPWFDHPKE